MYPKTQNQAIGNNILVATLKMDGKEIKDARNVLGISQTKLGELLGVSMRTIQNWEDGSRNISISAKMILNQLLQQKNQVAEDLPKYNLIPKTNNQDNKIDKIKDLWELKEKGAITEEQYVRLRTEIIGV